MQKIQTWIGPIQWYQPQIKNIFQYNGGTIAAAEKIKQLSFKVQEEAKDDHMIPGIQNNLLSTNKFAKAKYILIFDEEEVNIYDATNT